MDMLLFESREIEDEIFTGTSPEVIARAVLRNLFYVQGRVPEIATLNDWYMALAHKQRENGNIKCSLHG
ncbi:MAG TPA: hypothetical protein VLS90_00395 [Thermodesulfobacteriota bacterium]|nr:hypothetical protein [Thermodesulfobacteriota bacterium]